MLQDVSMRQAWAFLSKMCINFRTCSTVRFFLRWNSYLSVPAPIHDGKQTIQLDKHLFTSQLLFYFNGPCSLLNTSTMVRVLNLVPLARWSATRSIFKYDNIFMS